MNSSDDRYAIRSIDRALDILECVAAQNGQLTVDQIVAATGLAKSTATGGTGGRANGPMLGDTGDGRAGQTRRWQGG